MKIKIGCILLLFLLSKWSYGQDNILDSTAAVNKYFDAYQLIWSFYYGYIWPPEKYPIEQLEFVIHNKIKSIKKYTIDTDVIDFNFEQMDSLKFNKKEYLALEYDPQGRLIKRKRFEDGNAVIHQYKHDLNRIELVSSENYIYKYFFSSKFRLDSTIFVNDNGSVSKKQIDYNEKLYPVNIKYLTANGEVLRTIKFSYIETDSIFIIKKESERRNLIFKYSAKTGELLSISEDEKEKSFGVVYFYLYGRLTRITIFNNGTLSSEIIYSYDNFGRIKDQFMFVFDSVGGTYFHDEFFYDGISRLVKYHRSELLGSVFIYEYDFWE